MTRRFNALVVLMGVCLLSSTAFAQPSSTLTEQTNLQSFKSTAKYPERPNDMLELGIHAGNAMVYGDVLPRLGFGLGVHLRKSLGYVISVRGDFAFYSMYGSDDFIGNLGLQRRTIQDEMRGTGAGAIGDIWVYNYNTTVQNLSLDVMFNLNNINFHKSTNNWGFYAYVGGGSYVQQRAKLKQYISDDGTNATFSDDRPIKARTSWLANAEWQQQYHFGMGVSRKLNEKTSISLDQRVLWFMFTDRLDGTAAGNAADIPVYSNIRFNLNLGDPAQKAQPLWWLNPLDAPFQAINDHEEKIAAIGNILADADGDGVPDKLDKEMNSPAGAVVNTRGETLDSDSDGTPDYQDEDPYGIKTSMPKVLNENDIVNIGKKQGWDKITEITGGGSGGSGGSGVVRGGAEWFLPMIHFDQGSSVIKAQYYAQLHHVATVLNSYKDMNVVIEGHASADGSTSANEKLAQARAQAVADYLTKNYGIASSRFNIQYKGEAAPLPGAAPTNFMNRRVEFKVAQ